MKCKKIQELLKSDYLDDEISQRGRQYIKGHLTHCQQCNRLHEELLAQRLLFQEAKHQKVPASVWENIKNTIAAEQLEQENKVNRGIFERLGGLLWAPRPVFALASIFTVILFIAVLTGIHLQEKGLLNKEDNGEWIADYSLNGEDENLFYGLETNIEEYFL